ncbi:MlaD family protein [Nocardia callitridis]|uniref:MlaD family protein n=1 Tax=Nocardia callitridis TaxID=648753 RepID=A0ABP9KAX9_9NOCA
MSTHATPFRLRAAMLAVLVTVPLAACSTELDQLPLPAPGLGDDTYTVTASFSNALNLPTKATVKLNGANVGQVESMTARDYLAVVTLRIEARVQLPVGTTAELRSATPMGDVFVAVTPPAAPDPGAGMLHEGSTIGLESTSAAATIEEVLSRAALLVNGGTFRNLTTMVNGLGEQLDGRGDRLADMIAQTRQLLTGLNERSGRIRSALAAANDLTATVAAQRSAIADAVAAAGPALGAIADNTDTIVGLVGNLDRITGQLARFPSVQGTNDHSLAASINLLGKDLDAAAQNPDADLSQLNSILATILKVTDSSSAHVNVDIAQLALGAAPDPNFPGDPGAKMPDATDWANFVGSLQYNLNRLNERLNGPR